MFSISAIPIVLVTSIALCKCSRVFLLMIRYCRKCTTYIFFRLEESVLFLRFAFSYLSTLLEVAIQIHFASLC